MNDAPGTTEPTPDRRLDVSDLPTFAFGARTGVWMR